VQADIVDEAILLGKLCENTGCSECSLSQHVCPKETADNISGCASTLGPCNDVSNTLETLCGCIVTVRDCLAGVPGKRECAFSEILDGEIAKTCAKCGEDCTGRRQTTVNSMASRPYSLSLAAFVSISLFLLC
jgi:hypothetical protein